MMKSWMIAIAMVVAWSPLSSQTLTDAQRDYLNKEIRFLNETVHRMVIVFQVYENYNSQLTKHVDLPSNEGILNTAKHLPPNLFADNSLVIGNDSPIELYEELKSDPIRATMPLNSWGLIEDTRRVINFLNQDRGQLDQIIEQEDLDQFENIQRIYAEIEKALDNYDKVRNAIKVYEKLHQETFYDQDLPQEKKQIYTALLELHYDIKKLVRQLRDDSRSGVANNLGKIKKEMKWLNACIAKLETAGERSDLKGAIVSIELLVSDIEGYLDGSGISDEYKHFGNGYHVHNYQLLPKINEYGSGYVWKLEEFFKKYNWPVLNLLEEPHYIKIVYPERIPLEMLEDESIDPELDIRTIEKPSLPALADIVVEKDEEESTPLPSLLNIIMSESIKSDSSWLELDLFDHFKYDGDRVSVSFNGEWVLQNVSLEKGGKKVFFELIPGQENIVIIRADNEGWTTPNTVGISYMAKRTADNFRVVKDLTKHQAIELKVRM